MHVFQSPQCDTRSLLWIIIILFSVIVLEKGKVKHQEKSVIYVLPGKEQSEVSK